MNLNPRLSNHRVLRMFHRNQISKYFRRKLSQILSAKMSNKLGQEKSPYLLQHAHNPVNWLPWNDETIELAKTLQKPIFLSSGYSTCHWCHVMERESFENPRIASIMNEHFINIKLDREEHPDIDKIYMTFIQAISGSGGWPMSVWMTPELKPFYGGTYFPPEDRYFGRPGFRALLESLGEQWVENRDKCLESSNKIVQVLERGAQLPVSEQLPVALEVGKKCNDQLARSYEPTYGGFSEQPKFPQPVNLQFLIQYAKYEPRCFNMVDKTLKYMRKGGIYDHLGKGFCRYSTDKKWHVPHFEKMLYDQAQLTLVYLYAYLHSKEEFFSGVAQEILEYVSRDMSIPEGGFYSAEDADSLPTHESTDKAEGAFYAWEQHEIESLLGNTKLSNSEKSAAELFIARFGVKPNGNVDPYQDPHDELKKKNVIFQAKDIPALATEFGVGEAEVQQVLAESCTRLFEWRNANRPRPHLDNKFITSWNGLMISAYAQAGYILANQAYIDRAVKAGEFVQQHMLRDGDLLRTCYSDGVGSGHRITNLQAPIYGCVDDFSNVIAGAIDLFQATGHAKWIKLALDLQTKQNDLFWDSSPTGGGYFSSRATDKSAIVRMKDDDDGAEPSSNSVSLINLLRLQHLFPDKYSSYIERLLLQLGDRLTKIPITLPLMTCALLSMRAGVRSFTAVGKNVGSSSLVQALRNKLLPTGSLVILVDMQHSGNVDSLKNIVPVITERVQEFEKLGLGPDEVVIFSRKQSGGGTDTVAKTVEELEQLFE